MNENLENISCNYCGADNYKVRYVKEGYNIVQCNSCGLVYVNPRLKPEAVKELYDEDYFKGKGFDKSVQYREEFEEKSKITDLNDWDLSTIQEFNKTGSDKKILLDVGCGMGLFLWKAKQKGYEPEGLELSQYACNFVNSLGIEAFNNTIDNFESQNNYYDAISMKEVIEHLPDPLSVLEKVHKILKPGGVLFMTTGNYDCPERKVRGKDWFYFMPEGHLYIFSNKTMKKYLKKVGFRKIKVTNQGDLLMNFLLKYGIIETDRFKPRNPLKRLIFILVRFVNHFISSGLRIYAVK
jgi:2-polyprenyl-3-methyl-5-hydroxy-6-metoxy-1,4-benzoquinol methylase